MKWYWQFLQSYRFHKASLKVQKGHSKINIKLIREFDVCLIQAIYEELSCSQGPPRCCMLESLKQGHTKVKIKLGWNSDE